MDFGQRIADATSTKNQSYGTYNQYQQQANQAGTKFNDAFDTRQNYGDIYDAARDKYLNTDEINAARNAYQNARSAVDSVNTTIAKLPESIRQQYGGTGLTEAQRSRALQDQYQTGANTYNYLNTNYQNSSADYNDIVARAMGEVQNVAGGNYQSQEDALGALQSVWSTLLGQRNTAYGQYQTDVGQLGDVYSNRDSYQLAQDQMALDRWKEEQANARAAADRSSNYNLQKYLAGLQAGVGNKPEAPTGSPVSIPSSNAYKGNKNVVDTGGFGGLLKQGFQNVADYGPLALFGGGSLWR